MLTENTIIKDRYQLIKIIGSGGFSEEWLAADKLVENLEYIIKNYDSVQGFA